MSFQIFSRKSPRRGTDTVSITKGGIFRFNKTISEKFSEKKIENVLILWDRDKRLVGIRPITQNDKRAYRVNRSTRGDGCGFSAVTFVKHIGYDYTKTRAMDIRWDEEEGMFVFEIPKDYLLELEQNYDVSHKKDRGIHKRVKDVSAEKAETP